MRLPKLAWVMPLYLALLTPLLGVPDVFAADPPVCAQSPADQAAVVEAIRTMYAAATADDMEKFNSVTTADFYAFDGGKRFDGDALMELVKSAHAAGAVYVWTVTEPEVHVSCNVAWISYVNRGSMKNASGLTKLTWLESAVLVKEKGKWRIRFFHSTRAPQQANN